MSTAELFARFQEQGKRMQENAIRWAEIDSMRIVHEEQLDAMYGEWEPQEND